MPQNRRRKISNPQRLQLASDQPAPKLSIILPSEPAASSPNKDNVVVGNEPQVAASLTSRLGSIIEDLCRLTSDLALNSATPAAASATLAMEFLTGAHKQLLGGLGCLRQLQEDDEESRRLQVAKASTVSEPETAVSADDSGTSSGMFESTTADPPTEEFKAELPMLDAAAPTEAKRKKKQCGRPDKIDPTFVPWLSLDGQSVTLSVKNPSVTMSIEAHQRLLWSSRGVATLHLRALLKHFFSREVLAESSVTGAGAYKRQLDSEIVMGICDYISRRYPGALSESRMRLCCTDVCVQARRRRRQSRHSVTVASVGQVEDGDTSG